MWDDYRPLSGLTARLVQRVTALYMPLFVLFVPGFLPFHPKHSYAQRVAWIGQPAISIAVFVFFTALLSHMWAGLRDVLFDYARPCWLTPPKFIQQPLKLNVNCTTNSLLPFQCPGARKRTNHC